MEPYFFQGEVVLINKVSYIFRSPKIGDVIILKNPKDTKYIIKVVDRIKSGKYFVLGYNLKESTDSRTFGWITKKEIVGKIMKI